MYKKPAMSCAEIAELFAKREERGVVTDRINACIDGAWLFVQSLLDKGEEDYREMCDLIVTKIEDRGGLIIKVSPSSEESSKDKYFNKGQVVANARFLDEYKGDYINLIVFDQDPGEDWDLEEEIRGAIKIQS